MSGLMNSYFYGKAGKGDYTVEQMPTTRKQLFFTTLRVRFSSMMGLNLFHVLFCLPLILWVFVAGTTFLSYGDIETAKNISPELRAAYAVYDEARQNYEQNSPQYIAKLKVDISKLDSDIADMISGKIAEIELPPIEGAPAEKRAVTPDDIAKKEKELADMRAALDKHEKLVASDETIVETYHEALNKATAEFNVLARNASMGNLSMSLLILIPLIALAGIGSTGQMYVLRNWARDEHSFMVDDYKSAIKANWKQGLAVGLFNGLSIFLFYFAYVTYGNMAADNVFFVVPQMLMVVVLVVWWMMNEIIFPMMVTYDMTLRQLLRNSAIMVIARLPISLAILVGSLIPAFILLFFVPTHISILILLLFYGVIGFSLTGFVFASYANSCFDKFLNPRIEGAEVNKGLRKPEEDDDEQEQTAVEAPAESEQQ